MQGLLGWVPAQRQRCHLPALPLEVSNGLLSHGQLLLLCLPRAEAAETQARLLWRPSVPYPSPKRARVCPSSRQRSKSAKRKEPLPEAQVLGSAGSGKGGGLSSTTQASGVEAARSSPSLPLPITNEQTEVRRGQGLLLTGQPSPARAGGTGAELGT
jgi:hypothetical protein